MHTPAAPDERLYEEFLRWQSLGAKAKATAALRAFLDSFPDFAAKAKWTNANLEKLHTNRHARIRHELFEEVIFPVLISRIEAGDPEAMFQLARHDQNLFGATHLWKQMEYVSPRELLQRAHEAAPHEDRYRKALLQDLVGAFNYLDHEWPLAILVDAREPDVWDTLSELISKARILDMEGAMADRLAEFEDRVRQYRARISAKNDNS
ncbi:hypothetical protein [Erythrobacter sp. BLCC-B19]|uniref:hypothetical protein n=1 Tax=Erythrobacter sp. BLCC-B19 TaxID=3025315 RepID=UPI002360D34E|nr:hypothetical protein [Erythrobacter sp. BLCC-B19]WDA40218.1 hypothetical protein PS060_11675 [Erythrobacter sp. BLCC-B19]